MRRMLRGEHLRARTISPEVATWLVKLGGYTAADVDWLRAVGARWHPRDGSVTLRADGDGGQPGEGS